LDTPDWFQISLNGDHFTSGMRRVTHGANPMPDHQVQGQSADGQHPKLCGLGLTNGRSRLGHSSAQALRASDAVPEQYPSSLTPHVRHSLQAMALCQMLVERGMDINHGNVAWSNLEVNLQGQ